MKLSPEMKSILIRAAIITGFSLASAYGGSEWKEEKARMCQANYDNLKTEVEERQAMRCECRTDGDKCQLYVTP